MLKTAEQIAPCAARGGSEASSHLLGARADPGLQVTFDLAELHGYAYHTGAFSTQANRGPPWPAAAPFDWRGLGRAHGYGL